MVPADSGRISPVPPYSGYCASSSMYAYAVFTLFDPTFQMVQLDDDF